MSRFLRAQDHLRVPAGPGLLGYRDRASPLATDSNASESRAYRDRAGPLATDSAKVIGKQLQVAGRATVAVIDIASSRSNRIKRND